MMVRKQFAAILMLIAAALLQACGGGGSGSAGTPVVGGGDGSGTTVTAADLALSLGSSTLNNDGSSTLTVTATAVDSNRNALANVPITLVVDSNAVLVPASTVTDANGQLIASVGVGADRSNRVIAVTAKASGLSRTASFAVTGAKITSSLSLAVTPSSSNNQVVYRVSDVNSNALAGQEIIISAPGLPTATGSTDSTGSYTFVYTAPSAAGALTIAANSAGATDTQVVQVVSASNSIPSATGPVSSASLSASPDVVGVNIASSTANQTELRALFVAAGNKPVANIRVRFDLAGDANNIGGTFVSGTSLLYSNSSGVVTGAYRPGDRSSPTAGVTVRACWDYADFAATSCPNSVTTKLTVTSEPIAVTLGTNELIGEGDTKLTYTKQFVVMVVDAAGRALSGVTVTPVLDLPAYLKGGFSVSGGVWKQVASAACSAEDVNRNGVLDAVVGEEEDINGNGSLEPKKSDASVTVIGTTAQTDTSGMVVLQLQYPKNVASWVAFTLSVRANGVLGTEGQASFSGLLPIPAAAVSDTTSTPAFVVSPYGTASSCSDPN